MSKDLKDLTDDTRLAAAKALGNLLKKNMPCVVMYTKREKQEQYALWCQGRKPLAFVNAERRKAGLYELTERENKYTVTNCDGTRISEGGTGRSAHQTGRALDVVPLENGRAIWPPESDPRWKKIAAAFIAQGFTWGGDWDRDGLTKLDGDDDEDMVDYPHYQLP
jgi:peptidoglycan L-alanyl-D-glutamate endopeptidase CwlK